MLLSSNVRKSYRRSHQALERNDVQILNHKSVVSINKIIYLEFNTISSLGEHWNRRCNIYSELIRQLFNFLKELKFMVTIYYLSSTYSKIIVHEVTDHQPIIEIGSIDIYYTAAVASHRRTGQFAAQRRRAN